MTISQLPLSYCTNVHPGQSIAEVDEGLDQFSVPIRRNFGSPLAAGLWLAARVIRELHQTPDALPRFAQRLRQRELSCYTLNAFPYGDFHSARVKENVYLPDWTHPDRLQYTIDCARCLAALMDDGVEGSLSTVPLGFKPFYSPWKKGSDPLRASDDDALQRDRPRFPPAEFADQCADQLIELAKDLDRLRHDTGRMIRLAIEPEPFCVIETTDETIWFFERLRQRAADRGVLEPVLNHLGVCYDVCHQAVEFEDVAASIRSLVAAGIRINKVHITCAIEASQPGYSADVLKALASFIEPRYLHQTFAKTAAGAIYRAVDLNEQMTTSPTAEFLDAPIWRVHYHVPVDAEHLGPLGTTRHELKRALAVIPELDYAPHLEVETYTWEVLPDGGRPNIVDGFTRELIAMRTLLTQI